MKRCMDDYEQAICEHWRLENLGDAILGVLHSMGIDIEMLTPADLAPIDAFHSRGLEATKELASHVGVRSGWNVLDVGSGLGGTARYLAVEHSCHVTGLDITDTYCEVATMLSKRLRLNTCTVFQQGNALTMPFPNASFDLVWTEHTQMNIPDKAKFYSEISRVLKLGGHFAFQDIFQGPNGEMYFPVPWADEPSISYLIAPNDLRILLESIGFRVLYWRDTSLKALVSAQQRKKQVEACELPPFGTHLLMRTDAKLKLKNQARNLEEGRIVLIQAVLEKASYNKEFLHL